MATATRLTRSRVKRIRKPGFYGDGRGSAGLRLRVHKTLAGHLTKTWNQAITIGGRPTTLGLGRYPDLSLDEARGKAIANRVAIFRGIDPRMMSKTGARVDPPAGASTKTTEITFTDCARDLMALQSWKPGGGTQQKYERDLRVLPFAGREITGVSRADVHAAISGIWTKTPALARQRLNRISRVMSHAVGAGHLDDDPSVKVKEALPAQSTTVQHYDTVPPEEIGLVLAAIRERRARPQVGTELGLMLELQMLVGLRPGECGGARWEEIDLDNAIWTVPAERMKGKKAHRVPLSTFALGVLQQVTGRRGYVWGRKVVGSTWNNFMKKSGTTCSAHGMRSVFRTWVANNPTITEAEGEACLAHAPDAITQAYVRTDRLERRREIMSEWGAYVTEGRQ